MSGTQMGLAEARALSPASQDVRFPMLYAFVSGKGGVGKSSVVANLAVAASGLGGRVLVVDGDSGLANLDLLLGLSPLRNLTDVLAGRCLLDEAIVRGPRGIHVLPAGSGGGDLSALDGSGVDRLIALLAGRRARYDLIFVDAGAGIGPHVTGLAAACERTELVVTPEPTSLADAYATCKLLWQLQAALPISVLVNDARRLIDGRRAHAALTRMSERFLARSLPLRGVVSHDRRLVEAVSQQRTVVEFYPRSVCAMQLTELAAVLLAQAAPGRARACAQRRAGARESADVR